MLKRVFISLIAALAIVGCQSDEASLDINIGTSSLDVASPMASSTRADFVDGDSAITITWAEGDSFSIYDSTGAHVADYQYLSALSDGAARFACLNSTLTMIAGESYTAVFPAVEGCASLEGHRTALQERLASQTQQGVSSCAHLGYALRMESEFNYAAGAMISFEHTLSVLRLTFELENNAIPSKVEISDGDYGSYTLNLEGISAPECCTVYAVINPNDGGERTIDILVTDSGSEQHQYVVSTEKSYLAGCFYAADFTQSSTSDRETLTALYAMAGGDNWSSNTNWCDESKPLSEWYGLECDSDGNVISIDLTESFMGSDYIFKGIGAKGSFDVSEMKSLQSIKIDGNYFTTVDISGCSSLESINCYNNLITEINISGCDKLTEIECSQNRFVTLPLESESLTTLSATDNLITELDVSTMPNLEKLYCSRNALSAIDVQPLKSLALFDCKWNTITSLDFQGMSTLVDLQCGENPLSSISLEGCSSVSTLSVSGTNITELNLVELGKLTSLSCSSNASLSSITFEGCDKLEYLYCDNNNISSLSLNGCTSLGRLDCSEPNLDLLEIDQCKALFSLSITASEHFEEFSLSDMPYLEKVQISENEKLDKLTLTDCDKLVYAYLYNNALTSIDMGGCDALYSVGAGNNLLTDMQLDGCPALEQLDVSDNKFNDLGGIYDATGLVGLVCSKNQIEEINLSLFEDLTQIDCSYNNLINGIKLSSKVSNINVTSCNLTELDLTPCDKLLYLYCSYNPGITELNLKGSDGANKINYLWELELRGTRVTSLDVSGCTERLTKLNVRDTLISGTLDCSACSSRLTTIYAQGSAAIDTLILPTAAKLTSISYFVSDGVSVIYDGEVVN